MSHPLGLSIGTTNLVAARVGDPPMVRRAVLSLFRDRAPQIGLPDEVVANGVTLTGFVERVGDPVPMVAPDGTSYHADQLVAEALDALIEAAGGEPPTGQLAISVPAHWDTATLRAMRAAMRSNPSLAPNGVPARLVSDAVASLTALNANPGLPTTGTAALLDFGGGGTSITLAAADSSFEPVETVRYTEFSGDGVDQALLAHVLARVGAPGGADTAGTAAVSSLEKLRESCCAAKEHLSEADTATVPVDIPSYHGAIEVTRAELSELLTEPLSGVLDELDDLLRRNNIAWQSVSSVVAVGGGARIPMISTRLAEHVAARGAAGALVTTPQPALDAAVGAALFAVYGADADAQTGMAPAALLDGGSATEPARITGLDLPADTAADRVVKATGPSLAWSEDSDGGGDLLPYTGDDAFGDTTTTRAISQYVAPAAPAVVEPSKAWQRLPLIVFGVAALAAIAAVGGVTIALTGDRKPAAPPTTVPPSVSESPTPPPTPPPAPVEPPPPSTVTVTNEVPAPPPPQPSPTYQPPVTHSPAPTHTTTTHAPTTTPPPATTTTTATTATTTEPPPPPPSTTETTTTPTMTTSYIRLPFVPVPIPIQVPKGPDQPAESQPPANPYYPGQQNPYGQYPQPYPQYPQQYPY